MSVFCVWWFILYKFQKKGVGESVGQGYDKGEIMNNDDYELNHLNM